MSSKLKKSNVNFAWKLYNYLDIWENKIFGSKSKCNDAYILILSLIALHEKLSLSELIHHSGVCYKDIYKYVDSLSGYHRFIKRNKEDKYTLSEQLIKSVSDSDIKVREVNSQILCTVLNNMKHHTTIFQENLNIVDVEKFNIMRSLLCPVISNPIKANDCRKLSLLGYMKYRPQQKELKLNEVAYKKDWVGTCVI